MNPLTNIKNLNKMNERELSMGHSGTGKSWHKEYSESAWIFVGGLPYELTEGDILTVFSQYGEVVNINMVRDQKTGKFKGFGFMCYEDQRSTVLAVDNFNGTKLLGRTIRVDHCKDYKPPKEHGDEDDLTLKIREDGCAPRVQESSSEIEDDAQPTSKKDKKKKKKKEKKKKKKKRKKFDRSDTDVSDDEVVKHVQVKEEKIDSRYDKYVNIKQEVGGEIFRSRSRNFGRSPSRSPIRDVKIKRSPERSQPRGDDRATTSKHSGQRGVDLPRVSDSSSRDRLDRINDGNKREQRQRTSMEKTRKRERRISSSSADSSSNSEETEHKSVRKPQRYSSERQYREESATLKSRNGEAKCLDSERVRSYREENRHQYDRDSEFRNQEKRQRDHDDRSDKYRSREEHEIRSHRERDSHNNYEKRQRGGENRDKSDSYRSREERESRDKVYSQDGHRDRRDNRYRDNRYRDHR